ncbi:Peptidase family M50 [Roseovarius gaetbuli]|uniref:Peptidase family M50 n=1 Tax=Roseovarius gaetbuli TaxID=1356575 RepID=A0A1X6ZSH0_9RHOB|nr:hypothetical protein [Roseovarius gaetbuli]SLN60034.1 Peptidase family M50 [Roseovarius gaetbuli]
MAAPGANPFSSVWPKIAQLRPALRSHAEIYRQHFRGGLWYLIEDRAGGRFFRFSPQAYSIIGLMDGHRTMAQIYAIAQDRLGADLPPQDEIIQLLSQLHAAGVLTTDTLPDLEEISERARTTKRRKLMQSFRNPLGIRIPLLPIDGFISAMMPLVRPLFSWVGLILWAGLVISGVVSAGIHWQDLTTDITDRVLSTQGIALLLIAYPLVKALHELGHGFAVKNWGGQVREVGIMLLVFMPVPYVDASAATGFASKWQRIVVSSAGIMVELALAATAMLFWSEMEPGPVRALLFNIMLIGGVSTLLFNGNPLLRFDGYYIFTDLIEVPNLGQRSNAYLTYLVRRYLFGLSHISSPVTAPGERRWLASYAILAFLYRMMIMIVIALFVAGKFFFLGIALAIWSVSLTILLPIYKAIRYLLSSPELEARRGRALWGSAVLLALIAGPLLVWPVPDATLAQGVIWMPGETRVVAQSGGWLRGLDERPRDIGEAGTVLAELENPLIDMRENVVRAEMREARVRLSASGAGDPVRARIEEARMDLAAGELARIAERRSGLTVHAAHDGRFEPVLGADLEGRYIPQGELLGYLLQPRGWVVRAAIPQARIDRVNGETEAIDLRFSTSIDRVHRARLIAQTPRATHQLPSAALGSMGGGTIATHPASSGMQALESVFLVDLMVDEDIDARFFGERVYVRFDHGRAPLVQQAWRIGRQVFLDRFGL